MTVLNAAADRAQEMIEASVYLELHEVTSSPTLPVEGCVPCSRSEENDVVRWRLTLRSDRCSDALKE